MISKKQKLIYEFISSYSQNEGIAPSLEDIVKHFDFLKYPSSAHYHVQKLQDEGYLERQSNKPRSIGINADKTLKAPVFSETGVDSVGIPVYGSVNAGPALIFADESIEGFLKVSQSVINRKEGVFALRVEGDSMNLAEISGKRIEEGDYVLIDSSYRSPANGDYVLSILDGLANIKKFERDPTTGSIVLLSESSNTRHKPIFISSEDDFMVNGKIVHVIKK